MADPILLVLWPLVDKPGRYAAVLPDGRALVHSRQPLLDGARKLLAEGVPPETVLETRHKGSTIIAQRTTVGEAAKWTVHESDARGLQRIPYRPYDGPRSDAVGPESRERPKKAPG